MLVLSMTGGLGNQLFEIAKCYYDAKSNGIEWGFLKNGRFSKGQGNHPSHYMNTFYKNIRMFDIPNRNLYHIYEKQYVAYNISQEIKNIIQSNKSVCLHGYWQSEQYFPNFKEELRELLNCKTPIQSIKQIDPLFFEKYPELENLSDTKCFIGVRRGDYVITHDHFHNPCGMEYYSKAMRTIESKEPNVSKYYIASDDIEWCKKKFIGPQYVFFDINDDILQFYAGMLFQNYIISNSTYHWWISYFSIFDQPIVIAPNKWVFGKDANYDQYSTVYRKDMIVLDRIIEKD